jgi:hypothetical protein
MPQTRLPIFYNEATLINNQVGFEKRDGVVYYFNGTMPVYQHSEHDIRSFRLFTSQLVVNGNAKQSEIVKAFGVSPISVKRWVKKLREEGPGSFFLSQNQKRTKF